MNKNFIFNADDFGMSAGLNDAIQRGYNSGLLTAASLCANGEAFDAAIDEILPQCPNLSIGVHLNIIEGKSLTDAPLLTDKNGCFNNGYGNLIIKSFDKEFMAQAEREFRAQIEKIINRTEVTHIDSHVHVHAIPNIFRLTVRLAKEYNIPYVRTQYERPYFIPDLKIHLGIKYPVNLIKIALLNTFTLLNRKVLKESGLAANDYLIGVGYTGMMTEDAIFYGLKALKKDCTAEALIHPSTDGIDSSRLREFEITQNEELKSKIAKLGFDLISHKEFLKR